MEKEIEILKFRPCCEGLKFRKQYNTFKEAWENCPRGDWMLWMAQKAGVGILKLTTAKALCANTVRHLINNEKSLKAIDIALLYGKRKVTRNQLNSAYANAYVAYIIHTDAAADFVDTSAYATAANASNVDDHDAYTVAADAAVAIHAFTYNNYAPYADEKTVATFAICAKKKNQLETANICREILTEEVFKKLKIK